jgi:hypothetical protein
MLIDYVRVSKADGCQTLASQRDSLLAAGVDAPPPAAHSPTCKGEAH